MKEFNQKERDLYFMLCKIRNLYLARTSRMSCAIALHDSNPKWAQFVHEMPIYNKNNKNPYRSLLAFIDDIYNIFDKTSTTINLAKGVKIISKTQFKNAEQPSNFEEFVR